MMAAQPGMGLFTDARQNGENRMKLYDCNLPQEAIIKRACGIYNETHQFGLIKGEAN